MREHLDGRVGGRVGGRAGERVVWVVWVSGGGVWVSGRWWGDGADQCVVAVCGLDLYLISGVALIHIRL